MRSNRPGLRGAGGVRVGPAGQELLQAEELRGPELHDGPLATSGRACQLRTCLQILQRLCPGPANMGRLPGPDAPANRAEIALP